MSMKKTQNENKKLELSVKIHLNKLKNTFNTIN